MWTDFRERLRRVVETPKQVLRAERGVGPLLQRDYWAVIDTCRLRPTELVEAVRTRFVDLAPPDIVSFRRSDGGTEPLRLGDELDVRIRGAGTAQVRVAHATLQTFTLATLEGHPEAGRITFGAYRNERGDVLFHIRSRARSSSRVRRYGFLVAGDPMQTYTWTDFVGTVASTFGQGVVGFIHAETGRVLATSFEGDGPTFEATGD